MLSFSGDKDADVIGAFNSTSRYLDDLLNIDNTYTRPKTKRRYQIFHFNVAFFFFKNELKFGNLKQNH